MVMNHEDMMTAP